VGSAGRIPSRLVCETNLPEGRDRKIPTDLNQKTKTKNRCLLETKLRLEQGRPRHFGKINEDRDIINNPFNYTEMLEKSGKSLTPCGEVNGHMLADVNGDELEAYLLEAGVLHLTAAAPMRRPTGLATRIIIMSNAWQDPEVPARSATIKPTQAIWQNSSR
jgi:hypothetical protein